MKNIMKNIVEICKSIIKKPVALMAIGAALTVVLTMVLIPWGNTCKTPVNNLVDIRNAKSATAMRDAYAAQLNGFCEKEASLILETLWNTNAYKNIAENMEDTVLEAKDNFGSNFKCKMKVTDKDKLSESELQDFEDRLEELADRYESTAEVFDDPEGVYEEVIEKMELSRSETRDLVEAYEQMAKKCRKAKVTAGYELTITGSIKGSESSTEKSETTIYVYKVGGRWIMENALDLLISFGK